MLSSYECQCRGLRKGANELNEATEVCRFFLKRVFEKRLSNLSILAHLFDYFWRNAQNLNLFLLDVWCRYLRDPLRRRRRRVRFGAWGSRRELDMVRREIVL